MITINIRDAQAQLPKLLSIVSEGNEVIISSDDKPLAKLIPCTSSLKKRIAGLNKGKVRITEDFDEPLPEDFWTGVV